MKRIASTPPSLGPQPVGDNVISGAAQIVECPRCGGPYPVTAFTSAASKVGRPALPLGWGGGLEGQGGLVGRHRRRLRLGPRAARTVRAFVAPCKARRRPAVRSVNHMWQRLLAFEGGDRGVEAGTASGDEAVQVVPHLGGLRVRVFAPGDVRADALLAVRRGRSALRRHRSPPPAQRLVNGGTEAGVAGPAGQPPLMSNGMQRSPRGGEQVGVPPWRW